MPLIWDMAALDRVLPAHQAELPPGNAIVRDLHPQSPASGRIRLIRPIERCQALRSADIDPGAPI